MTAEHRDLYALRTFNLLSRPCLLVLWQPDLDTARCPLAPMVLLIAVLICTLPARSQ